MHNAQLKKFYLGQIIIPLMSHCKFIFVVKLERIFLKCQENNDARLAKLIAYAT